MSGVLPYVSVCIITYNQRDFIGESVQSALEQITKFPYEIVIGDDGSTDGTRDILKNLKERYPGKIILNLLPEKGKGIPGKENFLTTLSLCRGKYIAFLDGDDYWIAKDKLQKQADFLDANPGFALCHHDCITGEGYSRIKYNFTHSHRTAGFKEACQVNYCYYLAVMFRSSTVKDIDMNYWLGDLFMGDWPLWCLITLKGNAYFIDEKMGEYRSKSGVLSNKISYPIYLTTRIKFFRRLIENNMYADKKYLYKLLARYYLLYGGMLFGERKIIKALGGMLKSFKHFLLSLGGGGYKWIERLKAVNVLKGFFYNSMSFFKSRTV